LELTVLKLFASLLFVFVVFWSFMFEEDDDADAEEETEGPELNFVASAAKPLIPPLVEAAATGATGDV
jgi:hypothetical protein